MDDSGSPRKFIIPFAKDGGRNSIPTDSIVSTSPGAASLTDGFPALTRTILSAGGIPPSGLDMNGALYDATNALRWYNAGGGFAYDGTFATDARVGGYPKFARIARTDALGYWINATDNNTSNPESLGAADAGWSPDVPHGISNVTLGALNVTLTPLQYANPIIRLSGTLSTNVDVIFPAIPMGWAVENNTTGNYRVVARISGGIGAPVLKGKNTKIFFNGTDIALEKYSNQFGGFSVYSASGPISPDDVGGIVSAIGNSGDISLSIPPTLMFYPSNVKIDFTNNTAHMLTIIPAAGDSISYSDGNIASPGLIIQPYCGSTLVLETGGLWLEIAGSTSGWTGTSGLNSWQRLPNGTIIQRISASTDVAGHAYGAWPRAFTSSDFTCVPSAGGGAISPATVRAVATGSLLSQSTYDFWLNSATAGISISAIAIGR